MTRPTASPARFYPIVPDVDWVGRIVPLGVETVQLRIKDASPADVIAQTKQALKIARAHDCQLIVNDYWEAAIEAGADYIHLGQEDLAGADLASIQRAGIRFGISTHDEAELHTALAAKPDYVALGPVYETKLKAMRWAPQGLKRLGEWRAAIGDLPLVAIGGLTPERAAGAFAAGADSLAVVTDFIAAENPEARVRAWLQCVEPGKKVH